MTNAEKFQKTFRVYATEIWAMPESEFLKWLNSPHDSELPSAERTGKWVSDWNRKVKMIDGCPDGSCHCSYCGEWLVASDEYAVKGIYCPNCGARMMEGEEE